MVLLLLLVVLVVLLLLLLLDDWRDCDMLIGGAQRLTPPSSLFITTQAEKKKKDASEVKKLKLELFSPAFSVAALIATTAYITVQAVGTLVPAPPCNSSGLNISTAAMEMDMDPTLGGAGGGRWARGDGGVGGGGGSSHYFTGGEAPPPPLLPCEESDVRAVFPFPRCNPFLFSSIV